MTETRPLVVLCESEDDPIVWLTHEGTEDDARAAAAQWFGESLDQGEWSVTHAAVRDWDTVEDCDEKPHQEGDDAECSCAYRVEEGWQMSCALDDPRATQAWRVEWDG